MECASPRARTLTVDGVVPEAGVDRSWHDGDDVDVTGRAPGGCPGGNPGLLESAEGPLGNSVRQVTRAAVQSRYGSSQKNARVAWESRSETLEVGLRAEIW